MTTEEATKLQGNMSSLQGDFYQFKQDTDTRLAKIEKEQENLSKQVVNMYSSVDNRDEKIRNIMENWTNWNIRSRRTGLNQKLRPPRNAAMENPHPY